MNNELESTFIETVNPKKSNIIAESFTDIKNKNLFSNLEILMLSIEL